ncbi:MAG: glycosyltransferase [bacterium]
MRILYITPSFQHPKMRGPTRCYHFIRELSKRHAITLLSLTKSKVMPDAMKEMASYTERILTFNAIKSAELPAQSRLSFLTRFSNKLQGASKTREAVMEMKRAFLDLVHQECYDVILFHGKAVFKVIEDWNGLPIVADFCDATSMRILASMRYASLARLLWLLRRYLKVRQIEKKLIRKTPHLAFISERDRDVILGPKNEVKVIPLGMDLAYWSRKTNNPRSNCIVYTGTMDYRPNADGAFYLIDKIVPLLRRSVSNLEVFIVGRGPSRALIKKAEQYPDVTVTGFVEDIRPYFEQATVYAAPLRFASGMQNKLLEALAMEVPVVTTSIAADGLRVDGSAPPVLVANGKKQFAEKIIYLLKNKEERSRLATEGRRFIESHFVWSHNAEMLENMCLNAVKQSQLRQQNRPVSDK